MTCQHKIFRFLNYFLNNVDFSKLLLYNENR
nr:MAG TPA: hypothetical protein [Caudoviricetes sp.]